MPTYTFKNTLTDEESTVVMTLAERQDFLDSNPHMTQLITNPRGFIPGINQKPDDGFRDLLREMKKANRGSTIETF